MYLVPFLGVIAVRLYWCIMNYRLLHYIGVLLTIGCYIVLVYYEL